MQHIGKSKRLKQIFSHPSGKIVVVPMDDSLLAGATNGLEQIEPKIRQIAKAAPNAIIGFQGLLRNHYHLMEGIPGILNLTASTTRAIHTRKSQVGSVELALMLGVEAVAVHVNISSKYESSMLKIFGKVSFECQKYGMPLMAIMYPRKENMDGTDDNYYSMKTNERKKYAGLVAHAARVGAELGADFIKTQYTGDPETFKYVIEACHPVPVVIAGGTAVDKNEMLTMVEGAMLAGGAGISFGRNIFTRPDPAPFIEAVKQIVFRNRFKINDT